jgi:hypothetical protein
MFWQLWVALYNPRQTHHTFFINQAPTTKKITTFSFIFNPFRRPPRSIFIRTLNDTATDHENLIHACQTSSFDTAHPTSAPFEFPPPNKFSELNNNLKIIVINFSTCPTARRKMPFERNQTFNLATHPRACSLYFLAQSVLTHISPTILITTTTIQSLWLVHLMVQLTSLRDRAHGTSKKRNTTMLRGYLDLNAPTHPSKQRQLTRLSAFKNVDQRPPNELFLDE